MAIQVGDLTTNFIKTDVQDPNGVPDFDIENSPFKLSEIVINDLINRLDNLENMIEFKVDTGSVISAIRMTEEALLITADQIAIFGQTTFLDYIRDQNGTVIGGIDPKITQIIGDKIRTGSIWSNAWIETDGASGMVMDLDNSDFYLGGSTNPTLQFSSDALVMSGDIVVQDRGSELGFFRTGTADVIDGVTVVGDGIIMGTPGIFGASTYMPNGYSFALSATSGDFLLGDLSASHAYYSAQNGIFSLYSKLNIRDVGNPLSTDLWGYLSTGTADYSNATGATGSGCLVGTPGIYGLYNGIMKFGFNASTGDAVFAGELSAATGTFAGALSAATGTFAGALSAATGTFSGTLSSTKQVRCVTSSDDLGTDAAGYFAASSEVGIGLQASGGTYGIAGYSPGGIGVWGQSSYWGVVGQSTTGIGTIGEATSGTGVYGFSNNSSGVGVAATNTGSGTALAVSGLATFSTKITLPSGNGGTLYVSLSGADDYTAYDYYFT